MRKQASAQTYAQFMDNKPQRSSGGIQPVKTELQRRLRENPVATVIAIVLAGLFSLWLVARIVSALIGVVKVGVIVAAIVFAGLAIARAIGQRGKR